MPKEVYDFITGGSLDRITEAHIERIQSELAELLRAYQTGDKSGLDVKREITERLNTALHNIRGAKEARDNPDSISTTWPKKKVAKTLVNRGSRLPDRKQ